MVEILKSNWFVVLIAIIILSFVVYFIYDENKYNVSGKSVDGQSLLAAVGDTNITADQFYEEQGKFDQTLIYQMYKVAVLKESVTLTDDMKDEAKTLESTIRTNFQSQYGDDYEVTLHQQLASFGFSGSNPLYDYCVAAQLEKAASTDYIKDHFDQEAEILNEKKPRTISIISMSVSDPANLTEEEQKKKDNIDAQIESDGFGKAATSFSEDATTAAKKGSYGYIDSSSASASQSDSTALDASVINAALELEKDQISDWITVTNQYGQTTLYKVQINETDLSTIFNTEDDDLHETVLSAFMNADTKLNVNVVKEKADKLDIKFKNDKTKEKIDNYIKGIVGEDEENKEVTE